MYISIYTYTYTHIYIYIYTSMHTYATNKQTNTGQRRPRAEVWRPDGHSHPLQYRDFWSMVAGLARLPHRNRLVDDLLVPAPGWRSGALVVCRRPCAPHGCRQLSRLSLHRCRGHLHGCRQGLEVHTSPRCVRHWAVWQNSWKLQML